MARKKVLTKSETKLIYDTVRKLISWFQFDGSFELVYDDVVHFYSRKRANFSDYDLERIVIFHIGYWEGAYKVWEKFQEEEN